MSIFKFSCYKKFLQWKLNDFLEANPQQSLRGFAKSISVSPSRLSEVLSGKGNFNFNTAEKISQLLFQDQLEHDYFLCLHKLSSAKLKKDRDLAQSQLSKIKAQSLFASLDLEDSEVSQWYHYTILFLVSVNPDITISQISKALNLGDDLVEQALMDLRRNSFISMEGHKQKVEKGFFKVEGGKPSKAIQQFHKAMIAKSLHAMTNIPIEHRHFWSHIFTLNGQRYQRVVDTLNQVLDEVSIEDNGNISQDIYCLSAQFFPVSHLSKEP